jgi:predicted nucleic acid-binding protein
VKILVVDASALGEYLLGTLQAALVEKILTHPDADLHTPALCDVEVAAILRRGLRSGTLTTDRAADAVIDLVDLPLTRHGHLTLLGRILRLRDNFSAYDASYIALAEQLGADLLTADSGLVRATRTYLTISVIDASGAA